MKILSDIREICEFIKQSIAQAIQQKRNGIKLTMDEDINLMISLTIVFNLLSIPISIAAMIIISSLR